MTNHELKRLSRSDLLELLIAQSREMDQLRERLQQAEEQLNCRRIELNEVGSIAEASLELNGIFQAAQNAASQYLENIQRLSGHQKEICARMERESRRTGEMLLAETRAKCQALEAETQAKCQELLEAAKRESQTYRSDTEHWSEEPCTARKESKDFYAVRIGKDTEA